ncbi:MAG: VOC family protein [Gaiellaceae bacterium]|jgi:glyoxalase family protein
MRLEGIHHVTAVTGDIRRCLDFYTRVLGLRLVKKSVNQDVPSIYHVFFGDERGEPGSGITFFEYPGIQAGRAGAGMIHRLSWRVGSERALGFWSSRLKSEGLDCERSGVRLRFRDPEGLELELAVSETTDESLTAVHPEIPPELALQGFDSVRAYSRDPERSRDLLESTLAFERKSEAVWEVRGVGRGALYAYDSAPVGRALQGSGTVHHVAWAAPMQAHESWRERLLEAGTRVTPIIDRFWFRSLYFREPSGVFFEIATLGPGFEVDEPLEHLGERLVLPPALEHRRTEIESSLTPLPDPRSSWRTRWAS